MKILRGSLLVEIADLANVGDETLGNILEAVLRISARGGIIYITDSIFTANVSKSGRVFRISVGRGSIVVPRWQAGETRAEDLCAAGDENLCWELREDVWSDVRIVKNSVGFEDQSSCPEIYVDAIAGVGLELSRDPRALVVCWEEETGLECLGEKISRGRASKVVIPVSRNRISSEEVRIERVRGYRHPLAIMLGGRAVICRPIPTIGGICPGAEILVREARGHPLIYGCGDNAYILSCQPGPEDLIFMATLVYALSEKYSSRHLFVSRESTL